MTEEEEEKLAHLEKRLVVNAESLILFGGS
jgi:hypothetical protein